MAADTHALALQIVDLLRPNQAHGTRLADAADVQALLNRAEQHGLKPKPVAITLRTGGTHTYAVLDVSPAAYQEIRGKLDAAGYSHAFHDSEGDNGSEVIDMHGIALQVEGA